ncbi:3-oxoacyl-ACP reductase, partial [Leisingera sp. ANG-M1]|uniref:SDR family NAD(P)-dependent oxidoreductase n=1 Tax=Leisingera sp. ANG-M1 TaxID=1577895 RepID=UPI00058016B0
GEALAQELGGIGHTGSNLEQADLQALVDKAMDRWGRIDVLVNSAGHGPKGDIMEISDDDWHLGMEFYLMNVIRPARLVAPIMAAQGRGSIINISTFAVFEPDPL